MTWQFIGINVIHFLFQTIRAFLDNMMEERRGHIVNISSSAGLSHGSPPKASLYNASKAAVISLTHSIHKEILLLSAKDSGVSLTVVCPGRIKDGGMGSMQLYPWPNSTSDGLTVSQVADRVLRAVADKEFLVVIPKVSLMETLLQL